MKKEDSESIQFRCGRCFIYSTFYDGWKSYLYSLPKSIGGKPVRCPCCKVVILVPEYTGNIEIAKPDGYLHNDEEYEKAKQWHKSHNYKKLINFPK